MKVYVIKLEPVLPEQAVQERAVPLRVPTIHDGRRAAIGHVEVDTANETGVRLQELLHTVEHAVIDALRTMHCRKFAHSRIKTRDHRQGIAHGTDGNR